MAHSTKKILVPIDTIEHAYTYNAMKEAIDLASGANNDRQLAFLHVEYVEADLPRDERKRLVKAREAEMEEEFKIIREECERCGVERVDTLVKEGRPHEEIVKHAEEEHFDLIIIGPGKLHDRSMMGRIERFLYGSVTEAVLHGSPCSVLIVRRKDSDHG